MAILIKPDNSITSVEPKNGQYFELKELQNYVGGYIQSIRISKTQTMYVDEDAKIKRNTPGLNKVATNLIQSIGMHDLILGPAIVVRDGEEKDNYYEE